MVSFRMSAYIHRNAVAVGGDTLNVRLGGLGDSLPAIESAGARAGSWFPHKFDCAL